MNILIADDHYLYVQGIRLLLEEKDEVEQLLEAEDLSSVLEQLGQQPIDLLLLDLKMPGLGGMEVLREIKRFNNLMPVILLTGHGSTKEGIEGMRQGAYDYLIKPINIDELIQKINEAIEGK
ncbi:response regulator [Candidatus Peregrinibacteria bacterium]|nr:response regulator [Candidatus Peregrinibacteria bacterium]